MKAAILLLLIIIAGCQTTLPDLPDPSENGMLADTAAQTFESEEELRAFLTAHRDEGMIGFDAEAAPTPEIAMDTAESGVRTESLDYSGTNVQVEGVDEADILKTDGEYIYTITANTIFIIRAYPAENAEVISTLEFTDAPHGLFIVDDTLMVLGRVVDSEAFDDYSVRQSGLVFFERYDISDRSDPQLVQRLEFEGSYQDARMHDEHVYLVARSIPDYTRPIPLPIVVDGPAVRSVPLDSLVYYPHAYRTPVYATVHAISAQGEHSSRTVIVEANTLLYMSHENIYLAGTEQISPWDISRDVTFEHIEPRLSESDRDLIARIRQVDDDILSPAEKEQRAFMIASSYLNRLPREEREALQDEIDADVKRILESYDSLENTIIHRLSVDGTSVHAEASGSVPGRLNNQFSMDEHEGVLRLATTISPRWDRFSERTVSTNNIYTLDMELDVLDSVTGLAEDERIFAARFLDDRLYLVTFREVDPFFVVDLSDPHRIDVVGELKIPGFSRYLHPYDDDTIIGIGRDATETGRQMGLKISLFDVSDPADPRETASFTLEERFASSIAEWEHKAFLFSRERNLLVIPAYSYSWDERDETYNGALVFTITRDDIELRGLIDHAQGIAQDASVWRMPGVERSLYIEDVLYTKSPFLLRANQLDDLQGLRDVQLSVEQEGRIPRY